ncbi:MAG: adenylate/guanylate cyclase domain-containing protein [Muribaculaceae bacterium]|nr:adenylate/guanylate cyclase domain-containing protein [Muribaculaceae bacterium]MCM1441200.1 adenylate/guanylate cyclase domain-containing protein [Roseburia sp.]
MKRVFNGLHFYININNLNGIIKDDEGNHDDLRRTFHALNTFTAAMEKYADEFEDVEVEKFTTSRLHFYIPIDNNSEDVLNEMLELIAFAHALTKHINKHSKYQALIDFKIGAGADYGKYTDFNFEDPDSGLEEMTTIGSPANRAAKLQSLCSDGKVLISKEVYDLLPQSMNDLFFGNSEATLILIRKYADLSAYEADVTDIGSRLGDKYNKRKDYCLDYASAVINNLNLNDMEISDAKSKLNFDSLSIKNTKDVREASVLFADIRGFTKKVDESNLSDMKQLTQSVLGMLNKEVRNRNGVHVQFQGDRESAIFNKYSDETDDYVLRAVLCAMRMFDKLDEINKTREDKLNIGIGCSIGEVYAARIGMRGKKFNVAMGQIVKEADTAEDDVAGVGVGYNHFKSEIAITSDMYDYLVALQNNDSKYIKECFWRREVNNKRYYISTTRLSAYQKKKQVESLEQNSMRAHNNQGLKPWGCNN